MKENLIMDKSYNFGVKIILLNKKMKEQNEYEISKQVVRSGTSIGANITEADGAQTRKDFLCKMTIASKEARETRYWLKLINESKLIKNYGTEIQLLLKEVNDIVNILGKIVKTTQLSL